MARACRARVSPEAEPWPESEVRLSLYEVRLSVALVLRDVIPDVRMCHTMYIQYCTGY